MGFFSKARDMYSLQKQSKQIRKELKHIHIEAEEEGCTVVLNGEQQMVSATLTDLLWETLRHQTFGKKKLEELFLKTTNRALKKAQDIQKNKTKGIWEKMGMGAP